MFLKTFEETTLGILFYLIMNSVRRILKWKTFMLIYVRYNQISKLRRLYRKEQIEFEKKINAYVLHSLFLFLFFQKNKNKKTKKNTSNFVTNDLFQSSKYQIMIGYMKVYNSVPFCRTIQRKKYITFSLGTLR